MRICLEDYKSGFLLVLVMEDVRPEVAYLFDRRFASNNERGSRNIFVFLLCGG